jgi:hypothetical protein
VAFALVTAFASAPASAQQSSQPAVGLVLDVRGATEPALKPFREVRANDTVRLYSGAKLVVLQYKSPGQPGDAECRTLTVEGGAVTFKQKGDPVINGGIASTQNAKCPRRMEAKSTTGAVVLRGPLGQLTPTPSFVIAGARSTDVGWLRVLDSNKKIAELPVKGEQFTWPSGTPGLAEGQAYRIEFLARDNTAVLAWVEIFTSSKPEASLPAYIFID